MHHHLAKLLDYTAWADRRLLAALREVPAAQSEALPWFAHLLAAEHIWLCRVEGREPALPVWPQLSLEQCAALAEENAAGYAALVQRTSGDGWAALIHYRNTQGQEFSTPLVDILLHVTHHGSYHRGQVAKAIGRSGAQAIGTDYIVYVREVKAP